MLCALSGEAPQQPVVSRKSGNIYEKRLIESYISENGTEPTTGETITTDDLLDVKAAKSVRPRPPTLTSIPALLGVFQEEWDALALETFTLQQNLAQARQELSTALYQNDAAIRAITRLTRERDEARDALAKVQVGQVVSSVNGTNGDSMQVDNAPLPEHIITKIGAAQERLSKTRRKRPVPEGWATADSIASYRLTSGTESLYAGAKFLATDATGGFVLTGGSDSVAGVYSIAQRQITQTLQIDGGAVTGGAWASGKAVVSTDAGIVKVFDGETQTAAFQAHSASVSALTTHPSGDIVASVSQDKSYVLYDVEASRVLTQIFTDSELTCAQFHPDGHLLGVGGLDGQLKFYDVRSGALLGNFETGSPVKALFFSENGTWVAAANEGSRIVGIWDLRKVGSSNEPIKTLDVGGVVECLYWDYSAQFLLAGGPGGISVEQYTKSTKEWTEPLQLAVPASAVVWGPSAQSILTVDSQGVLSVLST